MPRYRTCGRPCFFLRPGETEFFLKPPSQFPHRRNWLERYLNLTRINRCHPSHHLSVPSLRARDGGFPLRRRRYSAITQSRLLGKAEPHSSAEFPSSKLPGYAASSAVRGVPLHCDPLSLKFCLVPALRRGSSMLPRSRGGICKGTTAGKPAKASKRALPPITLISRSHFERVFSSSYYIEKATAKDSLSRRPRRQR